MNTLDRPLFRQMGGPAQMMPDETMMAVDQAEAAGAQIGQQYLEGTMQSLDQAESPKEVIDAIRGNEQPLEARYQELAGFVGEADARQTPETVLALVQPTIMMTEEGAMGTGIAQLMQQMVGDVDMGGTDMGQGVGSLMMAGASEAPAPQNFNQGGAVAYLAKGSDDSVTAPLNARLAGINTLMESFGSLAKPPSAETVAGYYQSLLPMYQKILGEDEEAKRASRAGTFFDIAQAGLNLAAGVDPRTGRSTAGMPFASQLAAAASQLPAQISAREGERRAAERAVKATALETAMQQAQGEQGFRQTIGATLAKEALDPTSFKSESKLLTMPDGGVKAYNIDTQAGFADYQKALEQGAMPYEKPTADSGTVKNMTIIDTQTGTSQVVDVNTPEGKTAIKTANEANAKASEDGTTANRFRIVNTPSERSAETYVDPVAKKIYVSFDGGLTVEPRTGGEAIARPPGALPVGENEAQQVVKGILESQRIAKKAREFLGLSEDADQEAFENASLLSSVSGGTRDNPVALTADERQALENSLRLTTPDAMQAAREGTGPGAYLQRLYSNIAGGLGAPDFGAGEAAIFQQTLRAIFLLSRQAFTLNPRFPVAETVRIEEVYPNAEAFFRDPEVEAQKLIQLKRTATNLLSSNYLDLTDGSGLPDEEKKLILSNNIALTRLLRLLDNVPDSYANMEQQESAVEQALRANMRKPKSSPSSSPRIGG